jgi:16S rRNA (cytidine1402-2'-O)-methyltransferase
MTGTLYLVATPIGNLQDISPRALQTLKYADVIACEDTRHTGKLLKFYGIKNKLLSYHEHNEHERAGELTELLESGKNIAVTSDAGTPGICDPAFRIVQKAHEIGAKIVSIPGPAAFVNALVASGLPTDAHFFGGFLPAKKNERVARLKEVREIPATLVFYETPHRLARSLADCLEVLGNRKAAVARELTKLHEEIILGDLTELSEKFSKQNVKGEIVLVIDRTEILSPKSQDQSPASLIFRVHELENEGLDRKAALKRAAKEFGLTRSEAYRIVQVGKS